MALEIRLKPIESLLFRSDLVAVGSFRCPSDHPLFTDSGPCTHHTFVFPRTVTGIRLEEGAAFVGEPTTVAFYNQDQRYRRTKLSEIDACDWYVVADDVLLDVVARHERNVDPVRPFRFPTAPADLSTYAAQRRVFDAVSSGEPADPRGIEEAVVLLLGRVVASAYRSRSVSSDRKKSGAARDWIEQVKWMLARDCGRPKSLRELARAAGCSPYHLCRSFHEATGMTITAWSHSLRMRIALERLRERPDDLTELALDLGYSSHSHFTATFRRSFGVTPSQYRGGKPGIQNSEFRMENEEEGRKPDYSPFFTLNSEF